MQINKRLLGRVGGVIGLNCRVCITSLNHVRLFMLLSWADLMSVQPIFRFGVLVCTLCTHITDVSSMMSPRTFRSPRHTVFPTSAHDCCRLQGTSPVSLSAVQHFTFTSNLPCSYALKRHLLKFEGILSTNLKICTFHPSLHPPPFSSIPLSLPILSPSLLPFPFLIPLSPPPPLPSPPSLPSSSSPPSSPPPPLPPSPPPPSLLSSSPPSLPPPLLPSHLPRGQHGGGTVQGGGSL